MSNGIDNLARLFETEDIDKVTSAWAASEWVSHYKQSLQAIVNALDSDGNGKPTSLQDALHNHWPNVTLEKSERYYLNAGVPIISYGSDIPYASGHSNAATLFLNPSGNDYAKNDAQRIVTSRGANWPFSTTPIRATTKIITVGKLVSDPVSALTIYLDRIEGGIEAEVAGHAGVLIIPKKLFAFSPDFGFSLVGYGDALLKAAKASPEREREFFELAQRAYRSSGFRDTLYVGNKLLEIGELPPRAYVLVYIIATTI